MFVVKPDDFAAFAMIQEALADEVDQICNLILPVDEIFQLESTREFVSRYDPDILFNLTDENDLELEERFQVKTVKPDSDVWRLSRFGTNLMSFSAAPTWSSKFGAAFPTSVFATNRLSDTPESLFASVNFGYVSDVEELHLKASIFKDVSITDAPDLAELSKNMFDHERKYCHLTTHIGFGGGGGSSVWEVDYNPERHFQEGVSVFVGSSKDLAFLYYFWNSRAYNPFSNLVWVPRELLNDLCGVISFQDNLKFYVANDDSKDQIEKIFKEPSITVVESYYFSGMKTRWQCFDHSQSIQISGDTCYLQHPLEKTFSDIGIGAFVIEVQGLQECAYPVRSCFWDLYHPKLGHWELFQERFKRISRRGLAAYTINISFDNAPIDVEFPLPSYSRVMRHMFLSKGIEIQETPKSRLLSQLVNLFGGLQNTGEICKRHVFDLVYSCSPAVKTEVALKKLFPHAKGDEHDSRVEAVSRAVESGTVEVSAVFATADDLYSKSKSADKSLKKADFFSTLQTLYDNRVFLRGKNFDCPLCASNVWLPLERLSDSNYCPDCGNSINIPVHTKGAVDKDKYRLNQLLVRAVDQGQLSTLLLLNLLEKQEMRIFDFISNVEMLRDGKVFSDADILCRFGKKLGIAECKSSRSFPREQIDSMVDVIRSLNLDFGIFSSLLPADSVDLAESMEYIRMKNLDFPILIVTNEALFSPSDVKLYRYLELSSAGRFPVGPVVVQPMPRLHVAH